MAAKALRGWKTLSSDVILDHERLRVTEDRVQLPDGNEIIYVRHAPHEVHSVAVIAVNGRGEVLIQREYSYPPNKIMWQLPGGSMKGGESPEVAAKRELAEESGCGARRAEVLGSFYTNNRLSDRQQYVVLCRELFDHKLPPDEDEFIETRWMSRPRLSEMITSGSFDNINLLAALNVWFHSGLADL